MRILRLSLYVQKYGGTSVGSIERIKSVSEHIAHCYKQGHRLLVVVSAMGQQTDELLDLALALSPHPPQREVDMLLTVGERISMSLLAIALNQLKVPTLSFTGSQSGILTDNTFGNARIQRILGDRLRRALDTGKVVIVAGFQGMSEVEKEITTLGRGGSDLTAIALAQVLKADRCQIFKDVEGVCTADPRLVPRAQVMRELSWDTLSAMTSYGSGVVHHRGVHLAKKFKISLEICSSFQLDSPGTLVGSHKPVEKALVYALTHRKDLSWIHLSAFSNAALPELLQYLWSLGEHPLFIQSADRRGVAGIELVCGSACLERLREFAMGLVPGSVLELLASDVASVSVVGDGFWLEPELVGRIIKSLDSEPKLFECKNTTINFLLPKVELQPVLQKLHQDLLEPQH